MRLKGNIFCGIIAILAICAGYAPLYGQHDSSGLQLRNLAERAFTRGEYLESTRFHEYLRQRNEERAWTPQSILQHAAAEIELNHFTQADHELQQLIESYERSPFVGEAWLQRGLIALRKNVYGTARLYFNEALEQAEQVELEEPDHEIAGTALYWIGITHLVESNNAFFDEAREALTASTERYPENPKSDDALYALGMLAETAGNHTDALNYYRRVVNDLPASNYVVAGLVRSAQCLTLLRNYNEVVSQAERGMRELNGDGIISSVTPQYDTAGAEAALTLLLGNAQMELGNYPAAERAYLTLVYQLESPFRREAMVGLADTYLAAGRADSALAIYQRILTERRDDRAGMKSEFHSALAHHGLGQEREATEIFRSIAGDTAHILRDMALVELGTFSYIERNYAVAIEHLAQAVDVASMPSVRARALLLLGAAHLAAANPGAAVDPLTQAETLLESISTMVMPERDSTAAVARLLEGIALVQTDRPSEAITKLNRFLQFNPRHVGAADATYWLGEAYYKAGLFPVAAQTAEELIDRYPASTRIEDALYTAGWAYFKQGKFDQAQGTFERLVKAYPLTAYAAEAHLRRGDCFFLTKKYQEAIAAYGSVAKQSPSKELAGHALYQTALSRFELGQTAEARETLREFIAANDSSIVANDAYYLIGRADYRDGKYQDAIASMQQLIQRSDSSEYIDRAYFTIAQSYEQLDDLASAYTAFSIIALRFRASSYAENARESMENILAVAATRRDSTVMRISPAGESAAHMRAELLSSLGLHDYAIAEYHAILDASKDDEADAIAWLGIARSHAAGGDTVKALDTLRFVAREYPNTSAAPIALFDLASLSLTLRDTTSTLAALDTLRLRHPESDVTACGTLTASRLMITRGDTAATRDLLRANAEQFPTEICGAESWMRLADLAEGRGEIDTAVEALRYVGARGDSLGFHALYRAGTLLLAADRGEEALTLFETIIERFTERREWRAYAEIGLGIACEKVGLRERAMETYERIVKEHPDDAFAKQAEERLQAMRDL